MVDEVGNARARAGTADKPAAAPLAITLPLWAGDLPVTAAPWAADSDAMRATSADQDLPETLGPEDVLAGLDPLAELAEAKRRRTPPPLPKKTPPTVPAAPPIEAGAPSGAAAPRSLPAGAPADEDSAHESALAERVEQLPCWLTSLVVHLCLIILLNSFVVYTSATQNRGPAQQVGGSTITRLASGGPDAVPRLERDFYSSAEGTPETLETHPTAPISPEEIVLLQPLEIQPPEIQLAIATGVLPKTAPKVESQPSAKSTTSEPPAAQLAATSPAGKLDSDDNFGPDQTPRRDATLPRQPKPVGNSAYAPQTTTRAVPPTDQVPDPAADLPPSSLPDENAKDEIVDRFIAYDLGQLQGEDAARARRDFQSLRPDAIPALVRGLNRAAQIRGSCPAMVLATRLEEMLRQNNDPSLIRYAIEQLGRGVATSAPHASRLSGLRRRLVRQSEQVAEALRLQGIQADEVLLSRLMPLFVGDATQLIKAVGDSNGVVRHVAAMQIEERLFEFGETDRRKMARALVRLLGDPLPETAAAARSALVALADRKNDFGPQPGATKADVAEATRQWNAHFAPTGDVSNARVAKSLLTLARSLEDKGRIAAARGRYQDICNRFPGTPAAAEAEERLELLATGDP